MGESRERFDEAAGMIVEALRTGSMEGAGPFSPQPRAEIRPRPTRSFEGRLYAVASSDDSVVAAARLNARMVMFADRPWPMRMPAIQQHRQLARESTVRGYDAYAQKIALAREFGMDGIVSAFMDAAVWGPPDRILRKLDERRALVGDFELATSFRFGGTPFDVAETVLRLYAKEVIPVVHSWTRTGGARPA
jgi:hypothetical protein